MVNTCQLQGTQWCRPPGNRVSQLTPSRDWIQETIQVTLIRMESDKDQASAPGSMAPPTTVNGLMELDMELENSFLEKVPLTMVTLWMTSGMELEL